MKFIRSKKLVFFNNKGGVGKTTIAYNTAVKFAEKGYKTVLMDLDPQCNLSRLALGDKFEQSLFLSAENNIYGVLKGIMEGGSDINLDIGFQDVRKNLQILPGSLKLSKYQNLLINAYNQATGGQEIGYFQTSAINRFMLDKGLSDEVDIFVCDVSPSLDLLNRIILLGSDYFITPLMPDGFSVQGIENLGVTLSEWKENWKNTAKALAKGITTEKLLSGEGLFIGYIINSYNQYSNKAIKSHEQWIDKIPKSIKQHMSEFHCKNGLVESSWKKSLADIKDYGELPTDGQLKGKAIHELIPGKDFPNVVGTKENQELANIQFEQLSDNILDILGRY